MEDQVRREGERTEQQEYFCASSLVGGKTRESQGRRETKNHWVYVENLRNEKGNSQVESRSKTVTLLRKSGTFS